MEDGGTKIITLLSMLESESQENLIKSWDGVNDGEGLSADSTKILF